MTKNNKLNYILGAAFFLVVLSMFGIYYGMTSSSERQQRLDQRTKQLQRWKDSSKVEQARAQIIIDSMSRFVPATDLIRLDSIFK